MELSLFVGVFVGSCMIAGNINDGFKATLDTYILGAINDEGHVFVVLFTLFLSGLVGMMQKSGGMLGFTKDVSSLATTPRLGQAACFAVGCFVFFDDYANVLLAGETMRPLLDLLSVSREKLAFLVDATAAPVASISPVSSWVGFEVDLIQQEIDKIIDIERIRQGVDDPVRFFSISRGLLRYMKPHSFSSCRKSALKLLDSPSFSKVSSIAIM